MRAGFNYAGESAVAFASALRALMRHSALLTRTTVTILDHPSLVAPVRVAGTWSVTVGTRLAVEPLVGYVCAAGIRAEPVAHVRKAASVFERPERPPKRRTTMIARVS